MSQIQYYMQGYLKGLQCGNKPFNQVYRLIVWCLFEWMNECRPLLFRVDKTSLVYRIGVANPWDDCPYTKSNANTFVCACAHRVF